MKKFFSTLCLFLLFLSQSLKADEINAPDPVTLNSYSKRFPDHEINLWILCTGHEGKGPCVIENETYFFDKKIQHADGILVQEMAGIDDILSHMGAAGIGARLPSLMMSVNDSNVRTQLALAAVRSHEWREKYGHRRLNNTAEERTHAPHSHEMNALVGRLLFSSGVYSPLTQMLERHNLKIDAIDLDQVSTNKFSSLHIHAPDVKDADEAEVPVMAYFTIQLKRK